MAKLCVDYRTQWQLLWEPARWTAVCLFHYFEVTLAQTITHASLCISQKPKHFWDCTFLWRWITLPPWLRSCDLSDSLKCKSGKHDLRFHISETYQPLIVLWAQFNSFFWTVLKCQLHEMFDLILTSAFCPIWVHWHENSLPKALKTNSDISCLFSYQAVKNLKLHSHCTQMTLHQCRVLCRLFSTWQINRCKSTPADLKSLNKIEVMFKHHNISCSNFSSTRSFLYVYDAACTSKNNKSSRNLIIFNRESLFCLNSRQVAFLAVYVTANYG